MLFFSDVVSIISKTALRGEVVHGASADTQSGCFCSGFAIACARQV
jgi:hypothetical protein